MKARQHQFAFTLVELVVVIVLVGIIGTIGVILIRSPVEGYADLARRAELVDAAESTLRLMARDIRRALPNSIRCQPDCIAGTAIEMINTLDAVRYRLSTPGTAAQRLSFSTADSSFNAVGTFTHVVRPFTSSGERLVIYNLGAPGADAYAAGSSVITPATTSFTITPDPAPPTGNSAEDRITLSAGHRFPLQSPRQRLFLVDGPISYVCDTGAGVIRRYSGYALQPAQPVPPGVTGAPVTRHVTACSFNQHGGTPTRAALLTLIITLSDGGESVRLLHQVHVDNVP